VRGEIEEQPFTHHVHPKLSDPDCEKRPANVWVSTFLLRMPRERFDKAEKRREPRWRRLEAAASDLAENREPSFSTRVRASIAGGARPRLDFAHWVRVCDHARVQKSGSTIH